MRTRVRIIVAVAAMALLVSFGALAQPVNTCPCNEIWDSQVSQIESIGCLDSLSYFKSAQGHGDFVSNLHWSAQNECGTFLSLGKQDFCENRFGPVIFGICSEQEGDHIPFNSRAEQRDCLAAQREISRMLDDLPACAN